MICCKSHYSFVKQQLNIQACRCQVIMIAVQQISTCRSRWILLLCNSIGQMRVANEGGEGVGGFMMQPTVPAREWQPDVLRLRGVQNVLVLRPPPTMSPCQYPYQTFLPRENRETPEQNARGGYASLRARARRGTGKRFPTIQRIPFPVFASFTFHFRPPVGHAFHPAPPTTKRTQRTTEHRFPFRAGVAPPWPILQSTAPLRKSYI